MSGINHGTAEAVSRAREIAEQVAQLARRMLGSDVDVIWFGSWPQNRAQPQSDIDLAISAGRPISLDRMAQVRAAVDDLPTLYTVDLVDLAEVSSRLKDEILKHGVKM